MTVVLPPPPLPPIPSLKPYDGRDERGRWLPGYAPNPAGRPAVAAEVKKLAREYGKEAIDTLVALMRDEKELGQTRKAAADSLLDRGYGKPVQQIEAGGPGAFDDMDDDALQAYVTLKARKFIEGTTG